MYIKIRFIIAILFALIIHSPAIAATHLGCINRPPNETCTISMQSVNSSGTAATIFINQATTEYADPGGTDRKQHGYIYAGDLDPAYDYYVYCHCQYDPGTGYVDTAIWSYNIWAYESRVDAAVTSRSTYAGGAVASVTAAVTVGTNNDKTGYALTAAYDAAKTAASQSSVNAIPITPLLAANYTAPDNSDIQAIKADVEHVTYGLSALLIAINSRLAASGYTAPDNSDIASIKSDVENVTYGLNALLTSINSRLAASGYTAPDNASISAIKAKTDNLPADPASNTQVNTRSTLTAQQVWEYATRELTGKTGFALTSDYDPAKTCSQTEPDNANIDLIKGIVDKFSFDASNNVKSIPQGGVIDTVRHK
jgi:hypothetical protein